MYTKPLRCRKGKVRFWVIDSRGNLSCTLDSEIVPPYRTQTRKNKSYRQVQLLVHHKIEWFYVHRLMAFSWLGDSPPFLRRIVDHIDGNSLTNKVDNLRWVTSTANNINKRCYGLVEREGLYYPRVAGFTHFNYPSQTEVEAQEFRKVLVESYVRYTMRFPENGNSFPHYCIHKY